MSPFRLFVVVSAILALVLPAAAHKKGARELTFIYMRDADNTIMSGSLTDLERVKKQLGSREHVLWFRTIDGKELVVRDSATLDRFDAIWKTANALAMQQGTIGGKQGVIGARQGALGAKQGTIGMKQGLLATKQADLEERAETAKSPADREGIAKKRRAIENEMRELEQRMQVLEDEMRKLEKPMQELERQMDAIGKQHDAASKQATTDTEALIARAITSGIAKPF